MRRRAAVILLLGLGMWAVGGGAGAQTTTTLTSTSTTVASSTTTSTPTLTTLAPTPSTTVANPCDTQPCLADPPAAFLSGAAGEVRLDRGSSCWRSPAPNAQGQFLGRCIDTIDREPDAILVVQAGETLTLRFDTLTPTVVSLDRSNLSTPLAASNPVRFQVGPAVGIQPFGIQVVRFFTRWLQGDASYGVRLDVRPAAPQPGTAPPATPGTGPLSLTG